MASYSIDTARAREQLEAVNILPEQASVLVDLLAQSQEQVATKADIEVVRKDIEQLEVKIEHLAESTKTDLRAELAKLHTRIVLWIVGTGIAVLGASGILNILLGGGGNGGG